MVTVRAGLRQWGIMIEFTDALRTRMRTRLGAHERRTHDLDGRKRAAVAIVIVDSSAQHDYDPLTAAEPAAAAALTQSLDLTATLLPFERWPLGELQAAAQGLDLSAFRMLEVTKGDWVLAK